VIPGAWEAIGATAALLAYSLAVLLWRPARAHAATLLVIVVALAALATGLHPFGTTRAALWRGVLVHPAFLTLVILALFQSQVARGDPLEPTPANAVAGGLLLGWLPTVALLVPGAPGPRRAARLALLATAASAISPIGGPVQILLADGTLGWSSWALVPAIAAVGVAWPWKQPAGRPEIPWRVATAAVLGIAASWALGGLMGIAVAAGVLLGATWRRPPPSLPIAERGRLLGLAVAAHLAGSFAQAVGIGWMGAWAIDQAARSSAGPAILGSLCAAGGLLAPPVLFAAVGERIADALVGHPQGTHYLLALPAVLSPVPPLLLAAGVHGRAVWRPGLAIGAVQLGIALGWILLAG